MHRREISRRQRGDEKEERCTAMSMPLLSDARGSIDGKHPNGGEPTFGG